MFDRVAGKRFDKRGQIQYKVGWGGEIEEEWVDAIDCLQENQPFIQEWEKNQQLIERLGKWEKSKPLIERLGKVTREVCSLWGCGTEEKQERKEEKKEKTAKTEGKKEEKKKEKEDPDNEEFESKEDEEKKKKRLQQQKEFLPLDNIPNPPNLPNGWKLHPLKKNTPYLLKETINTDVQKVFVSKYPCKFYFFYLWFPFE